MVFQILVTDLVFGFSLQREVKDRPVGGAPKVVFVVVLHYQLHSQVTFSDRTSMSFRDLPLL